VQATLGRHLGALDRSIDVHISRLRKKLARCGADDARIKSVRGAGYIYTAIPDAQHNDLPAGIYPPPNNP
jgi:DNA-binding response OmpR family regulator